MNIDRCYCFDSTFATLKEIAVERGATTIHELQEFADFGKRCALCHPYVKEMLKTGKTAFNEVIEDDPTRPS